MKFIIALWVASTASLALADSLVTDTSCFALNPCNSVAEWHASDRTYYGIDVNKGCRNVPVNGMDSICMDWDNKRMHFVFHGQGKRCMRLSRNVYNGPCGDSTKRCYRDIWDEVGCNW